MARVYTIEELSGIYSSYIQTLQQCLTALRTVQRNRDQLFDTQADFSTIETEITSQLEAIEDLVGAVATNLAALDYTYAEVVFPTKEQYNDHFILRERAGSDPYYTYLFANHLEVQAPFAVGDEVEITGCRNSDFNRMYAIANISTPDDEDSAILLTPSVGTSTADVEEEYAKITLIER